MAENQLDTFLKAGDAPDAEAAPVERPAAEPEPKGEAAAKPAVEPAKPEPDDAAPEPEDGKVAFQAFERERARRQDWKEKAVRAETERDELRRQLDESKRVVAPQPQPVPVPQEIPNPAVDPAGYHAYVMQEQTRAQINHLLNVSEMHAIKEHGAEKIEAMKVEFLAAKDADPSLGEKLIQQRDPYGWAMQQIDKIRAQREIGDDPAAYRARIIAKHEAARAAEIQPARVSPAAGMAPSLASVRSVAGRSAPAFTGPTPLSDILRRN